MKLQLEDQEGLEQTYRNGHALVVLTIKKSVASKRRKADSDFSNLVIRVLKATNLLHAAKMDTEKDQLRALKLRNPRKYRGFLNRPPEFFHAEHDAYRRAYSLLAEFQSQLRKARIAGEQNFEHQLYCMHLDESSWEDPAFRKFNAMFDEPPTLCYYVGQTSNPVLQRLQEHIDPDHQRNTRWGQLFFPKEHLSEEWKRCRTVVDDFSESQERPVRKISRGQALIAEADFARWLQEKGFGAYFA